MKLDMTKKWSERSREERDRILYAPFPVIRYVGSGAAHGGAGLDYQGSWLSEARRAQFGLDPAVPLEVRHMVYEWAKKSNYSGE